MSEGFCLGGSCRTFHHHRIGTPAKTTTATTLVPRFSSSTIDYIEGRLLTYIHLKDELLQRIQLRNYQLPVSLPALKCCHCCASSHLLVALHLAANKDNAIDCGLPCCAGNMCIHPKQDTGPLGARKLRHKQHVCPSKTRHKACASTQNKTQIMCIHEKHDTNYMCVILTASRDLRGSHTTASTKRTASEPGCGYF